jgi:hypothetical protein
MLISGKQSLKVVCENFKIVKTKVQNSDEDSNCCSSLEMNFHWSCSHFFALKGQVCPLSNK